MKSFKRILIAVILLTAGYMGLFLIQNDFFKSYKTSPSTVDRIIAENISDDMSEYEKVKAIHDYIVSTTEYDSENYNKNSIPQIDYTAKGALEEHKAVCRGYAEAFKLLMDELDIECKLITGKAGGISHAWNVVKIDEEWFQVDCTYDDPVKEDVADEDMVRYDYFLVTTEQMNIDHKPDNLSVNCVSDKYMYQEKVKGVPYVILEDSQYIPATFTKMIDEYHNSVTFYYKDYIDLSMSTLDEQIGRLLASSQYSFTEFYYNPSMKCGDYYYTTITVK